MSNQFKTGDVVCLMKNSKIYKLTVSEANERVAIVDGVEYKHWSGRENVPDYQRSNSMIWHWRDNDTARLELQGRGIYSANYKEAQ